MTTWLGTNQRGEPLISCFLSLVEFACAVTTPILLHWPSLAPNIKPDNIMCWQHGVHYKSGEKIIWFLLTLISLTLPGSSHSAFSVSGHRWWWKKSDWLLEALTSHLNRVVRVRVNNTLQLSRIMGRCVCVGGRFANGTIYCFPALIFLLCHYNTPILMLFFMFAWH